MSEGGDAGEPIPRSELERLAGWYDRYEFADDPLSTEAREAEVALEDGINDLYERHVKPASQSVSLRDFRTHARDWCRKYLAGLRKKSSAPPPSA